MATKKKEEKKVAKKADNSKDIDKKLKDLKIELLKHTQKRKSIKREIARALTMKNQTKLQGDNK